MSDDLHRKALTATIWDLVVICALLVPLLLNKRQSSSEALKSSAIAGGIGAGAFALGTPVAYALMNEGRSLDYLLYGIIAGSAVGILASGFAIERYFNNKGLLEGWRHVAVGAAGSLAPVAIMVPAVTLTLGGDENWWLHGTAAVVAMGLGSTLAFHKLGRR